jgi:hypothetical protein
LGKIEVIFSQAHIAKVHADDTTNVASPASVGDVISLNDGDDE